MDFCFKIKAYLTCLGWCVLSVFSILCFSATVICLLAFKKFTISTIVYRIQTVCLCDLFLYKFILSLKTLFLNYIFYEYTLLLFLSPCTLFKNTVMHLSDFMFESVFIVFLSPFYLYEKKLSPPCSVLHGLERSLCTVLGICHAVAQAYIPWHLCTTACMRNTTRKLRKLFLTFFLCI